MKKICEYKWCKSEFDAKAWNQKFCSDKCRCLKLYGEYPLLCKQCNGEIDMETCSKSRKPIFCSHKCYGLDKKKLGTRICDNPNCEVGEYVLNSTRDNQKYCSRKCFYEHKKELTKKQLKCSYENCNKEYEVYGSKHWKRWGDKNERKFCSKECADKARIGTKLGDEAPSWKGGSTSLQDSIRKSSFYKRLRKQCFERDNYISILSDKNGKLHHHHIVPYATILENHGITKDNWREKENMDVLFDIDNVVTLLASEHRKFHSIYGKVSTKENFYKFLREYKEI